jgi:hypothetical protein
MVATARSDAASPMVRLLLAVSATSVVALALTWRHVRHLTSRLRDAEAREVTLVHQAGHDPLTGLTTARCCSNACSSSCDASGAVAGASSSPTSTSTTSRS